MKDYREHINLKVLMYHRVVPSEILQNDRIGAFAVSEENFRRQMRLLDKLNFTPITFEDYQFYLNGKLTLPKKPVIITFDDGHRDTFEIARPILNELGMKAVIFVMGNRLLKNAVWDSDYFGDESPLMSDEQIIIARSEGFEIGAHSMNHQLLNYLNEHEIKEEVLGAKESIEQLLGQKILSFAYPYGMLDGKVYEAVKESGFIYSCSVFTGPPRFGDDPYKIRRVAISDQITLLGFLIRLLFPYQYVEWLYGKLKPPKLPKSEPVPVSRNNVKPEAINQSV